MQEHIFERMARERNISVEEMRAIISDRIEKGWNDEDPEKREQWRKIPCAEIFQRQMNGCDMRLEGSKIIVKRIC